MDIQRVTIAGGGVLGSQIGYQCAYKGFDVTIWLRSDASIERAKPKLQTLHDTYMKTLQAMKDDPHAYCRGLADSPNISDAEMDDLNEKADAALGAITLTTDVDQAFADADLVVEAITENVKAKEAFYTSIRDVLPEHALICTNSSTLLPSQMADYTGRPDRFVATHFSNQIWRNNTAEIMGSPETSEETYRGAVEFVKDAGMIPLELKKEQPGYLLNSMLIPFLNAAEALYANDVADPQTIDKAWTLGTGAPIGPFGILDIVGLVTAYNIVSANPQAKDASSMPGRIAALLKKKIDAGETGMAAGKGFYNYPDKQ